MFYKFNFKNISKTKILNSTSASIVFVFSFLLIFFSKTDYFLINKLKSFSNDIVNPITKIVSYPVTITTNTINNLKEYNSLNLQNQKLKQEILRLKKWQILAIQNSRENKVFKKLLNSSDNNLTLIKTASIINRNEMRTS